MALDGWQPPTAPEPWHLALGCHIARAVVALRLGRPIYLFAFTIEEDDDGDDLRSSAGVGIAGLQADNSGERAACLDQLTIALAGDAAESIMLQTGRPSFDQADTEPTRT